MPRDTAINDLRGSVRRHVLGAGLIGVLLVFGLVGWSAGTRIAGAVVASGTIRLAGGIKDVQHQEGGIVRDVLARDDDRVAAGDIVVRLDDTTVSAQYAIVASQLADALAQSARLTAESTGREMSPPRANDSLVAADLARYLVVNSEILDARQRSLASQERQISEQILQLREEVSGYLAQRRSLHEQEAILTREVERIEALVAAELMASSRLDAARREQAQLSGERERVRASIGRVRAAIAERETLLAQLRSDAIGNALGELSGVTARIAELEQQLVALADRRARLEIVSPGTGIVHRARAMAPGAVIGAGEKLMQIVPTDDDIVIDVEIDPFDVDKVAAGQPVKVEFIALGGRTAPQVEAVVAAVGSETITATQQGAPSHYRVRIELDRDRLAEELDGSLLVSGMPVRVFIETEERTVLSYLTKPLTEQFELVFRDG